MQLLKIDIFQIVGWFHDFIAYCNLSDIINLIDEVNSLKLVIQSLAVQLVINEDKIVSTDTGGEQIHGEKIAPEILFNCETCEYYFEKKSHLRSTWT